MKKSYSSIGAVAVFFVLNILGQSSRSAELKWFFDGGKTSGRMGPVTVNWLPLDSASKTKIDTRTLTCLAHVAKCVRESKGLNNVRSIIKDVRITQDSFYTPAPNYYGSDPYGYPSSNFPPPPDTRHKVVASLIPSPKATRFNLLEILSIDRFNGKRAPEPNDYSLHIEFANTHCENITPQEIDVDIAHWLAEFSKDAALRAQASESLKEVSRLTEKHLPVSDESTAKSQKTPKVESTTGSLKR